MKQRIFILYIFLAVSINLVGQQEHNELITDRPDMTESASVVPLIILQLDASGGFYLYDETGYFGSFGVSYRIPK